MSFSRRPPFDNFGFHEVAQNGSGRQSDAQPDRTSGLPEVYIPPPNDKEVVKADGLIVRVPDESAPMYIDDTLPELVPFKDREALVFGARLDNRICGLKNRNFWIAIFAISLIVIAVVVGGVVGGVVKNKQNTSAGAEILLASSKLAALNFTDENNVDHSCVYYQLASKAIYQSVWNSSSNSWTVYPVVTDVQDIANETAISTDLTWKVPNERRHHVFYYDTSSHIRGKSSNTPYTSDWDDNIGIKNAQYTGNGNSLASYGRACETCLTGNLVAYRDAGNGQNFGYARPNGTGNNIWKQYMLGDNLPRPGVNSAMTMKSLYSESGIGASPKYAALWMTSERGTLAQLFFDGDNWGGYDLNTTSWSGSAIAAFTFGTYNESTSANYTFNVFNTQPKNPDGGVIHLIYDSIAGSWTAALVEDFSGLWSGSGIAATQAGKVYGVTFATDGSPQLNEWQQQANGTFINISVVDTPS